MSTSVTEVKQVEVQEPPQEESWHPLASVLFKYLSSQKQKQEQEQEQGQTGGAPSIADVFSKGLSIHKQPLQGVVDSDTNTVEHFEGMSSEKQESMLSKQPSKAIQLLQALAALSSAVPVSTQREWLCESVLRRVYQIGVSYRRQVLEALVLPEAQQALVRMFCSVASDTLRWRSLRLLLLVHADASCDDEGMVKALCGRLVDAAHDLRVWLPPLQHISIPTQLVSLDRSTCQVMKAVGTVLESLYFRELARTKGTSAYEVADWTRRALDHMKAGADDAKQATVAEYGQLLGVLAKRLDAAIKQCGGSAGAFVRLSSRSPKDALVMTRRGGRVLSVSAGEEAVEMLLSSNRVMQDLSDYLKTNVTLPVVAVRQWQTIPRWTEMRGFVCGGKLTGLSQYFAAARLPQLIAHQGVLARRIEQFFEDQVKSKLPFDTAVVDFALSLSAPTMHSSNEQTDATASTDDTSAMDPAAMQLLVLEVNPFARSTGACLFKWCDDYVSLCNGPLQVRVRE